MTLTGSGQSGSRKSVEHESDRTWRQLIQVAVLVTLTAAIFYLPFQELVDVRQGSFMAHITFAEQIAQTGVLFPGHFLYHLFTIAIHWTTPLTWEQATVVVLVVSRVITAVILWMAVRRSLSSRDTARDSLVAVALPLTLLFCSAITFLTWNDGNYYLGYIPPNIYVSQTVVVLQPLALLAFLVSVRVLDPRRHDVPYRELLLLAGLATISVLAKPSYAMVMVPAVGVILLSRVVTRGGLRRLKLNVTIGVALFIPVLIAMVWIYTSTYLEVQDSKLGEGSGSGIAFRPLLVMDYLQRVTTLSHVHAWLALKLVLSVLFPLIVTVVHWSTARKDLRFQLAWLQLGFGLMFTYGFAEVPRYGAGNFTWSAQTALFVLIVVAALFLVEQRRAGVGAGRRSAWSTAANVVCWGVFLLHVAGGVGLYLNPTVT